LKYINQTAIAKTTIKTSQEIISQAKLILAINISNLHKNLNIEIKTNSKATAPNT